MIPNDPLFEEPRVNFEKAQEGDEVIVKRLHQAEGQPYLRTYITNISEDRNVITVELGDFRFRSDGLRFDTKERYHHKLIQRTVPILDYIHRQYLVEKLSSILWPLEHPLVMELVLRVYEAGRAIQADDDIP